MLYRNYQLNKTHSALKFGFAMDYPAILRNCRVAKMRKLHAFGNTAQDGTPTPDNPVEVQGVGDRTANLFDYDMFDTTPYYINSESSVGVFTIQVPNGAYTLSTNIPLSKKNNAGVMLTDIIPDAWSSTSHGCSLGNPKAVTATNGVLYLGIYWRTVGGVNVYGHKFTKEEFINGDYWIMLNKGSATVPYEPYGYKIPLVLSNSDGETQTFSIYPNTPLYSMNSIADTVELDVANKVATLTRKYGIISFDGSEVWNTSGLLVNGYGRFYCSIVRDTVKAAIATSNFFEYKTGAEWSSSVASEYFTVSDHFLDICVSISSTRASTVDEFKTWLSEQAAAGTPLTVVYQLATPVVTDISNMQDWDNIPKLNTHTNIITSTSSVLPSNLEVKYIRR